jgi:hypothetical protein
MLRGTSPDRTGQHADGPAGGWRGLDREVLQEYVALTGCAAQVHGDRSGEQSHAAYSMPSSHKASTRSPINSSRKTNLVMDTASRLA